jgi:uncharacterized protein GlcG (DUF336 family)
MLEMTLDIADRAARSALAQAMTMGVPMTASVVDEAGRLVVVMRGDRAGFLTIDTSRAKAVAAAAFKRSTRESWSSCRKQTLCSGRRCRRCRAVKLCRRPVPFRLPPAAA